VEEIESIYLGVTAKIAGKNHTFLSSKADRVKIIRNSEMQRYEITDSAGVLNYIEFANVRQATVTRKENARPRNTK
jgi:hypothetical protein